MNLEQARSQMLSQQVRAWEVLDESVLDTLGAIPRELFVPDEYGNLAFADAPIPLDHEQEMMTPKMEGRLLQALGLSKADQILEVGTGSGYLTACLATLGGNVTSVDIYQDFVDHAKDKLEDLGVSNVTLEHRDGLAMKARGQYDAIAVTGSVPSLSDRFVGMLKPGGRLFIVVGNAPVMAALLITTHGGGTTSESLFETSLPPLIGAEQTNSFVF